MTTLKEGIAELATELNERKPRLGPDELRAWRLEQGMTQRQAAEWVGVSRRLWIRWEQRPDHVDHRPTTKWLMIIVGLTPLQRPNGEG